MSLQAYQTATTRSENPRATEYRLFAQVTRALMAAREKADDIKVRADALDWNRRVWSTLALDCSDDNNGLPEALRAGIISLSLFVSKHSSAVLRSGADIDTLIEINRMIMQGLEAQAQLAKEPVAAHG
ncbi:flagellar biosynthesis regulator FlaF [Hyphobacterium marinum]|uniref:Flagellar biosynthesis regulator FlaF n=1 Tax=Hyphobacterium marinum TaxID=3116574 RepID=A0ABU7LZP5_9PROT|nr:flagellar biosynthesis regulator FlaF [Hyphobacterium sp. Y6023]MEE2567023.1 flagellar biosynthesis regulator FlaF [Hyphobacterium sp. Y6023]